MSDRMAKVNELLRQELSIMIHEKQGGAAGLITVTDVETTSDLQLATVHISVLNADAKDAQVRLQEQARYFQQQLAGKLRMKFIPKLAFVVNDEARRERVEQLLEEIE